MPLLTRSVATAYAFSCHLPTRLVATCHYRLLSKQVEHHIGTSEARANCTLSIPADIKAGKAIGIANARAVRIKAENIHLKASLEALQLQRKNKQVVQGLNFRFASIE